MSFDKKNLIVYAVTDRSWLKGQTLLEQVEAALRGGATMVQLREKKMSREEMRREALEMQGLCARYQVPFIINDDVELAREIDADGVHVGQDDMEAAHVRSLLGAGKIIGVSVGTLEEALRAQEAGADYLGLGAVFPTGTKLDAAAMSRKTLQAICSGVQIPCVAIGGIHKGNILDLRKTGLAGIAVVSALFAQADIQAAACELRKLAEEIL